MTPAKTLTVLLVILALTLSGCTTDDEPSTTPTHEKAIYTTPDGMNYYAQAGQNYDSYWGAYDTNNDDVDIGDALLNLGWK